MFLFSKNTNSIRVNEIERLLGKVQLVDIREPYEYATGHVSTAQNIPMNTILSNPQKHLEKNKEYYIICQSGGRSQTVCNILFKQGFNVINVTGGTGSYTGKLVY